MSYLTCLTYILGEWTGVEHIEDYLSYAVYLLWVLLPLAVVFVLPGSIVILFYTSILLLHIYKRKNELKEAYSQDFWAGGKQMLATLWDGHGRIWHGKQDLTLKPGEAPIPGLPFRVNNVYLIIDAEIENPGQFFSFPFLKDFQWCSGRRKATETSFFWTCCG